MATAAPDLTAKCRLLELSVISSTSISNRTTALLAHIKSTPGDSTPAVVALKAKASVANKLVSIVEIAKRELKDAGSKVYQYNALASELIESKPATKDTTDHVALSDEEAAFQDVEQKTTVRNVPVMTTYLSLEPIKELRNAHG
ncbi:hypothetical protein E4T39_07586 [Aureobasidium subglaciale]|nr:hypothetical protein E4T39_07586 [Aureobasidium subglaciale]